MGEAPWCSILFFPLLPGGDSLFQRPNTEQGRKQQHHGFFLPSPSVKPSNLNLPTEANSATFYKVEEEALHVLLLPYV